MRYAIVILVLAALVGCPSSPGKLVVVNNTSYSFSDLNAYNLDGEYSVRLVTSENPLQPGEARTFFIVAEGYYTVYASTSLATWYYGDGQSVYFGPNVTITWNIGG